MSVYGNMAQGLVGGIGAGMALQRRREERDDREVALDIEAQRKASTNDFITAWQDAFDPLPAAPVDAAVQPGTTPAAIPGAPAAPASAIPAAPGAAMSPAAPAAPAAAAPAPRRFARRADIIRLEQLAFEHEAKFGDGPMAGVNAVEKVREKLNRDGKRAFQDARAAFKAGDLGAVAELSQLAASYSPDGYIPTFKQGGDGKLYVRFANENNGKPAGDPVPVTDQMWDAIEAQMFMDIGDRRKDARDEREQTRKETDTESNVAARKAKSENEAARTGIYREAVGGANAIGMANAASGQARAEAAMLTAKNGGKGGAKGAAAELARLKFVRETPTLFLESYGGPEEGYKAVTENPAIVRGMLDSAFRVTGDEVPVGVDRMLAEYADAVVGGASPADAADEVLLGFVQQRTAEAQAQAAQEAAEGEPAAAPAAALAPPAYGDIPGDTPAAPQEAPAEAIPTQ